MRGWCRAARPLCLALEAGDAIGVGRDFVREHFDRDAAAKPDPCRVLHAEAHRCGRGPFGAEVIEVFTPAHVDGGLIYPGAFVRCPGADHQHRDRQGKQYSEQHAGDDGGLDRPGHPALGKTGHQVNWVGWWGSKAGHP